VSPSSPRARFWRRLAVVIAAFWLLSIGWTALTLIGIFSSGSAGIAAVSAGLSEFIVETLLILPVAALIAWMWGRILDRRS
jgi:hypothetical protein